MQKIVFMLSNMNIGGTEKAFLNLVDTLSPYEYDITLLLLEKTGGFLPDVPNWIHIESIPNSQQLLKEICDPPALVVKSLLTKKHYSRAAKLAATHLFFKITRNRTPYYKAILSKINNPTEYDIAIAYSGPFDFITVYVLEKIHAREKYQWIHFDISRFHFNQKTCKHLYPRFDKIYAVSDEARHSLVQKMPKIAPLVSTYRNIVSVEKCHQLAKEGTGFSDGFTGMRIVTLGRLGIEKGQLIIPEIANLLRTMDCCFKWYIIGDGATRNDIQLRISELNLNELVVMLGQQKNPYPFLQQADIYVQTSIHEGFCITLSEALAFDLPIVSTPFAGAKEQLTGHKNCYIVDRSADSMATIIRNLIFSMNGK